MCLTQELSLYQHLGPSRSIILFMFLIDSLFFSILDLIYSANGWCSTPVARHETKWQGCIIFQEMGRVKGRKWDVPTSWPASIGGSDARCWSVIWLVHTAQVVWLAACRVLTSAGGQWSFSSSQFSMDRGKGWEWDVPTGWPVRIVDLRQGAGMEFGRYTLLE